MSIRVTGWDTKQPSYVVGLGNGDVQTSPRAITTIKVTVDCSTPRDVELFILAMDLLAKDGEKATDFIDQMLVDEKRRETMARLAQERATEHNPFSKKKIRYDDENSLSIEF